MRRSACRVLHSTPGGAEREEEALLSMQSWIAPIGLGFVLAVLPALAGAAEPADPIARLTAATEGAQPCFARSYGSTHFEAHPRKLVESVAVTAKASSPTGGGEQGRHELVFAVKLKQQASWLRKAGICVAEAGHLACRLDGEAGSAVLAALGQNGLRLETGPEGIGVDGPDGNLIGLGGAASDDNVFILHASPRAICVAASGEPAP